MFAHMNSPTPLAVGQQVNQGDYVGAVGNTGHSEGAHLHYEIDPPNNEGAEKPGEHMDPGAYSIQGMSKYGRKKLSQMLGSAVVPQGTKYNAKTGTYKFSGFASNNVSLKKFGENKYGAGIWDSVLVGLNDYAQQRKAQTSSGNINVTPAPATGSLTPEQIMQLLQAIISLLGQIATNTAGGNAQAAPAGSQAAINPAGDIGNILQSVQGLLGQNNQNLLSKIGGMISAFGGGMSAQDKLASNLRTLAAK